MKYRLSVHSFRRGCEGNIGDVVDVSDADAAYLDEHGAGKRVVEQATDKAAEAAAEDAKQKPAKTETAESKGPKSAEKRG